MTSKQFRWAAILIGILAVLNIALMASVWLQHKPDKSRMGRPHDARELLVHELSLNPGQVKAFDSLREIHFAEVEKLRDQMREKKDALFSRLPVAGASPDSAAASIGYVQTKIELATFRHFASLRSILNEKQQEKFDNIIGDMLRSMGRPDGPGGDGPPPDRRGNLPPGE